MRGGDYNSNCPLSRSKPFRTNLPIEQRVQAALIRTRSIERASRIERAVSVTGDVRVGSFGFDLTTSSARAEPDYNTGELLVPPAQCEARPGSESNRPGYFKYPLRVCSPRRAPALLTGLHSSIARSVMRLPHQPTRNSLRAEVCFQRQYERLVIGIVRRDGCRLRYVAFVSFGLCNFESDAARFARSYRLVEIARRAAAGRSDILDLQGCLTLVLDLEGVGKRRASLYGAELMLEGRGDQFRRTNRRILSRR